MNNSAKTGKEEWGREGKGREGGREGGRKGGRKGEREGWKKYPEDYHQSLSEITEIQNDDLVDSASLAVGNLPPCPPSHLISALHLRAYVKHKGEKLLNILVTVCFFVKSTRYFETETCLLETPFPFPFQTTFTFFPTFIIST